MLVHLHSWYLTVITFLSFFPLFCLFCFLISFLLVSLTFFLLLSVFLFISFCHVDIMVTLSDVHYRFIMFNNTVYNVHILTYTCSQKHNNLSDGTLCNMQHSVIYNCMLRPCNWVIIRLFVEPVRWLYNRSLVWGGRDLVLHHILWDLYRLLTFTLMYSCHVESFGTRLKS